VVEEGRGGVNGKLVSGCAYVCVCVRSLARACVYTQRLC
jgi:hypothetical protein